MASRGVLAAHFAPSKPFTTELTENTEEAKPKQLALFCVLCVLCALCGETSGAIMKFRKNSLTRMRAKSPVRGKHAKAPSNQEFYFFEDNGMASCNGATILFAPNLGGEKTSRELVGKALHSKDARRIAKELPKGRIANSAGLELTVEKGNLFVRDAKGVMHQAHLADRVAPD